MECLEKLICRNYARDELFDVQIEAPDENIRRAVLANWDNVAKPIDGMGRFETLIAQMGAIARTEQVKLTKTAVIIMCADNGIVEEGVSQSGQEVTIAVAEEMTRQQSSVGKMAKRIGVETILIDIGIQRQEPIVGLLNWKVRCGTRNFRKEPAMLEEEVLRAISIGIHLVANCKAQGYQVLATGELGIGNTTTSSAVVAALLSCEVNQVTGRGAGLSDERLLQKQKVIAESIERYELYGADPLTILGSVGGLDIAGLVGVCIGGAISQIPIVLDGVISMAAALLAERILPGIKNYLIASHQGKEPAMERLVKELQLLPVIHADLALGEGTGAVMMLSLLELALCVYGERTTFADIQIEPYRRYEAYDDIDDRR